MDVWFGWWTYIFLVEGGAPRWGQKVQPGFHQTVTHFPLLEEDFVYVFAKAGLQRPLKSLATLSRSPNAQRLWVIVATCVQLEILADFTSENHKYMKNQMTFIVDALFLF